MNDTGRHMGLLSGRMNGRASGAFAGRFGRSVLQKTGAAPTPSEWDADFLAFWERTSGTMNDDWKASYNQLVKDLKAAGIWSKSDAFYVFASENEADARLNLIKNAHTCLAYNSPSFVAKSGFQGNGSSAYLDAQFSPYNNGLNFTFNDAAIAVYIESAGSGTYFSSWEGGAVGGTMFTFLGGNLYRAINSGYASGAKTDAEGIAALTRNNSNEQNVYIAENGTTDSIPTSYAFANYVTSINFLRRTDGAFVSAGRLSMGYIGGYLSSQNISDLKTAINAHKARIAAL